MRTSLLLWLAVGSTPAVAGPFTKPLFSVEGELGASARYLDNVVVADPTGFGANLGARLELNLLMHARTDLRYFEGKLFHPDEDRFLEISGAARTPRLLVFCADVHEVYWRPSTREGDALLYVLPGLGVSADLVGSIKGTLGYTYVRAHAASGSELDVAHGAFLGVEYLLRARVVDLNLRGAGFLAWAGRDPTPGVLADGDVFFKIPAGAVFLGPRLDVAYRNLGLTSRLPFAQRHELTAHLGFAVQFGTGSARAEKKRGRQG